MRSSSDGPAASAHATAWEDSSAGMMPSSRATYEAVTDAQALDAFQTVARLEGIIPALESSHAVAWALAAGPSELDLICLSGRGDKDLDQVTAR